VVRARRSAIDEETNFHEQHRSRRQYRGGRDAARQLADLPGGIAWIAGTDAHAPDQAGAGVTNALRRRRSLPSSAIWLRWSSDIVNMAIFVTDVRQRESAKHGASFHR
jgi:hypothetical protein